jgi:peroxiredoxin/protein-disulfide isomerase
MPALLQPGIVAPDVPLKAANTDTATGLAELRGQWVLLLFLPEALTEELAVQLGQLQQRLPRATTPAVPIGISDASPEALRAFAAARGIACRLVSDAPAPGPIGTAFGARSRDGRMLTTVFLIDEEGLIRRAYDPDPAGRLPNPAAVERALNKFADAPKPAPLTAEDWRRGSDGAFVTLVEYSDYECAHCAEAHRVVRGVVETYRDDLLLVHRHYLLRRTHPHAQVAAEAAEAAGAQGKFWEMHAQLFEAGLGLERQHLIARAEAIGLDVPRFAVDLDSRRFEGVVNAKFQSAVRDKVKFPPAVFINRIPVEAARTKAELCGRIDRLLACKPRDAPVA